MSLTTTVSQGHHAPKTSASGRPGALQIGLKIAIRRKASWQPCELHELMRLRERSIKHLQPFFTLNNATDDIICCDRVDFYTN